MKLLPNIIFAAFLLVQLVMPFSVFAQGTPAAPAPGTGTPAAPAPAAPAPAAPAPATGGGGGVTIGSTTSQQNWVPDPEVNFAGKTAVRAKNLLNWVLSNYQWSCLDTVKAQGGAVNPRCGTDNPFDNSYKVIRNIVYILLTLFILATAFLIIITRGQNITVVKFIPRFLLVLFLVTFSFTLVRFTYQVTDLTQGFFLKTTNQACTTGFICQADLLNIAFDYKSFSGFRLDGAANEESAFISLLFVKLTALTYYAMSGILLLRKVVLWFFIIISPVFPLLLLYTPIRNTGKIWLGEFFRWLLYGPLFAILLSGLVAIWQQQIPLEFKLLKVDQESDLTYPTAINILLGGPKVPVGQGIQHNSLNSNDQFAQYFVALLMLWMVILLPFILLHIFLGYMANININGDSPLINYIRARGGPLLGAYGLAPTGKPPAPSSPKGAGSALSLPVFNQSNAIKVPSEVSEGISESMRESLQQNLEHAQNIGTQSYNNTQISSSSTRSSSQPVFSSRSAQAQSTNIFQTNLSNQDMSQVLQLTNLNIPTMEDIVRYETQIIANDAQMKQQLAQMTEALNRLSATSPLLTSQERDKYSKIKQSLTTQAQAGNPIASSVLKASQVQTQMAAGQVHAATTSLPKVNQVQQVNIDDYEVVKKMWRDNFKKLQPPKDETGKLMSRKTWIQKEKEKIQEALNLLTSSDPEKQKKGREIVGQILPFLLLGGFSEAEVQAYLKAKLEAANDISTEVEKELQEEDQLLDRAKKKDESQNVMHAEAELPTEISTKKIGAEPLNDKDEKTS